MSLTFIDAMDCWSCPVCRARCKIDFPLNNLTTCPTHGKMTMDMLADLQIAGPDDALKAIVEWQRVHVRELDRWEVRLKESGYETPGAKN